MKSQEVSFRAAAFFAFSFLPREGCQSDFLQSLRYFSFHRFSLPLMGLDFQHVGYASIIVSLSLLFGQLFYLPNIITSTEDTRAAILRSTTLFKVREYKIFSFFFSVGNRSPYNRNSSPCSPLGDVRSRSSWTKRSGWKRRAAR